MTNRQHDKHKEHVRGLALLIAGIVLLVGAIVLIRVLDPFADGENAAEAQTQSGTPAETAAPRAEESTSAQADPAPESAAESAAAPADAQPTPDWDDDRHFTVQESTIHLYEDGNPPAPQATPTPRPTVNPFFAENMPEDSPREHVGLEREVTWGGVSYRMRTGLETVLLIGYDKLTEAFNGYREGGQADFLVVSVVDRNEKKVHLLQINRDTMVRIRVYGITGRPAGHKVLQIALAHAYTKDVAVNDQNTAEAVANLLNIRVDHTASMPIGGIRRINSLVDGVTVTLTDDLTSLDPALIPGETVTLTDDQAEMFVRARMGIGDGRNTSRMRRQRDYINAFIGQVERKIRGNSGFINTMVNTLYDVGNISASKRWFLGEMDRVFRQGYAIGAPVVLESADTLNPDTYLMESYLNDDAVIDWVLGAMYARVDPE